MHPLYHLTHKGATWDWEEEHGKSFKAANQAMKTALGVIVQSHMCDLDVHVTPEGYGWGLWQQQGCTNVPTGFWSQLWKGVEA